MRMYEHTYVEQHRQKIDKKCQSIKYGVNEVISPQVKLFLMTSCRKCKISERTHQQFNNSSKTVQRLCGDNSHFNDELTIIH